MHALFVPRLVSQVGCECAGRSAETMDAGWYQKHPHVRRVVVSSESADGGPSGIESYCIQLLRILN